MNAISFRGGPDNYRAIWQDVVDYAAEFGVPVWTTTGLSVIPPEGWFRYLRELCDRYGILLVCDEVQSGMGRSGRWWAIEHEGVTPDIVTSGKGIASGLPLGAMIARDDLMRWELGSHGSTYGGSPLSCAAAHATFDVIEDEGLLENATKVGDVLLAGLRDIQGRHPILREVRGRALWIGLGFEDHDAAARVELEAYRRQMGWAIPWVSAVDGAFSRDMGVTFPPDEIAAGDASYNYQQGGAPGAEAPGFSAFERDADGSVYHCYSAYARGLEPLNAAYGLLDLMPHGRDEADLPFPMAWVRRHPRGA